MTDTKLDQDTAGENTGHVKPEEPIEEDLDMAGEEKVDEPGIDDRSV